MSLRDKLNIYTKKESEAPVEEESPFSLESIGGSEIITEDGPLWRVETRIKKNESYKDISFDNYFTNLKPLLKHSKLPLDLKIEDFIFFDLETTSLSIGAGNYPFLIGIGYVDDDDFVIEQLFMKEYSDEIPILKYILPFFQRAKAGISFNGKTFDFPLLKNRFMLNKVYGFPVNLLMLDLIIPSRRIFKSLFENCALQTLEKNVIGFTRVDDVPGWMIPDVYFTFQKEGDWQRIPGVIEHNKLDMLSMYYLTYIISEIFSFIENREYEKLDKQSLFNIGKHLYNSNIESFLDLMEYLGMDIIEDESVLKKFSITLKRESQWAKALAYWEKSSSLFSLLEMAKYYEHREKNLSTALDCCEKIRISLEKGSVKKITASQREYYTRDLEKRVARLMRKNNNK